MTFPLYDLNVQLNPTFIAAVDQALQSDQAKLVVVYAIPRNYGLFLAGDYLRMRARATARAGLRKARILSADSSSQELPEALDTCMPGDMVFLPELRPSGPYHEVSTAAQFVNKSATVITTIHGWSEDNARARLEMLWAREFSEGRRAEDGALPPYRLIAYAGSADEVPAPAI